MVTAVLPNRSVTGTPLPPKYSYLPHAIIRILRQQGSSNPYTYDKLVALAVKYVYGVGTGIAERIQIESVLGHMLDGRLIRFGEFSYNMYLWDAVLTD